MTYTNEVIFRSLEEAKEYYEKLGFTITKDNRILLDKRTQVEIKLYKLGPQLLRSAVIIIESPSDESLVDEI